MELLRNDLDEWLSYYNNERPHSGRYCFGKSPMQTFVETLALAKDEMLHEKQEAELIS